ncbi:hypothetical protein [Prosthecobacter sp.]|uniref:hypothetical protein n=1 Tax=Prosthecobacter sp. TaxID=1965333 RepID=UPI003783D9A6
MLRTFLVFAAFSLLPLAASAHSLWIEELPEHAGLGVRFAQWGDEYEVSPGHLDSFWQVAGWTVDGKGEPQVLDVVKKKDHFFLGKTDGTKPVFAQAQFTVRKLHEDKPARAPIFYCRWQPEGGGAGTPMMTMDVVPTGKPGEARVYFRGKPLPNVELLFFSPKVTDQKLQADSEGYVRAPDISKPGQYLLAVARYSEDLAGYFQGVPYGITSHSASLYWTVK